MPHIRIFRHYVHTPFLLMSLLEVLVLIVVAYTGFYTRNLELPEFAPYLVPAIVFSLVLVASMIAMGVYESRIREGYSGMMLRTAVAIFLLGTMAVAIVSYLFPVLGMGRGVLLFSTVEAFVAIGLVRWVTGKIVAEDALKTRVLVLGTGRRALKIATRMRRKSDQRGFVLVGFLDTSDSPNLVGERGARVLHTDISLLEFCEQNDVDEIVVAVDERRRNRDAGGGVPIEELMDCRLGGIDVCEVQAFIEREASKIDVDLLHPSWVVFADGFVANTLHVVIKRGFDIVASLALLAIIWPVMLIFAFLIGVGGWFRDPVLYKQERVGLNGKTFEVMKFRSMRTDAEEFGAVWATQNDPRVTRIGNFIRKTRIDELPQLFNVLRGDMSFVGPRPERPMFVSEIAEQVPYYEQRHRVKPGITGWAQLCYPYGASIEDSKEKLQYDLYYLKNHSLLLDLIILLQTVEVVLVGEGAR